MLDRNPATSQTAHQSTTSATLGSSAYSLRSKAIRLRMAATSAASAADRLVLSTGTCTDQNCIKLRPLCVAFKKASKLIAVRSFTASIRDHDAAAQASHIMMS